MKSKTYKRIYLLAIMGIFFISPYNCTKPEEPSNIIQTVLPEKLIVTPDIYTEEMDVTSDWTATSGAVAVNNTEYRSGTGSLKLACNAGTIGYIKKTVSWNLSADQGVSLRFWAYVNSNLATTITSVVIYAMSSSNDIYSRTYGYSYLKQSNWILLEDQVTWVVAAGNPDWNNITKVLIKVISKSEQSGIVSFDLIEAGYITKPAVLICFDDGNESDYTKAYPLLAAKKMVATSYVISNSIGSEGRMSAAQLQELNINGWDIANHTKSHVTFGALTQVEIEAELNDCKVFLDGLGLSRASLHVSYPFTDYSGNTLAAMVKWGAKTGRKGGGFGNIWACPWNKYEGDGLPYDIDDFPFGIVTILPTNVNTVDDVMTEINLSLAEKGSVIVITLHEIVDSNADGTYQWLTSQFSDLLDYIESLELQTLTIDEYYRLYSGSITVNHK